MVLTTLERQKQSTPTRLSGITVFLSSSATESVPLTATVDSFYQIVTTDGYYHMAIASS